MANSDVLGSAAGGAGTGFMAGGPWGAVIGAGVGLGKGLLDSAQAERERKRDAVLAALSPWSGIKPMGIHEPDFLGSAMQGGTAGAGMTQNAEKLQMQRDYLNYLKAQPPQAQPAQGQKTGMQMFSPWEYV